MTGVQDTAPAGGFPTTIRYKRNLPRRGPSGAIILLAVGGMMAYGLNQLVNDSSEKRF
jgi:NADH dehydrogenase (ubiquinone) 1 alpha subcomplex subunit 13